MDFDDAIVFCRFPDRLVDILDKGTNAGTTDVITVDGAATARRRKKGLVRRKAGDAIGQIFMNTNLVERCRTDTTVGRGEGMGCWNGSYY